LAPAYEQAQKDPGGRGVKRRLLDILSGHARAHAPQLFVSMRQDLAEGVTTLEGAIKPQLRRMVEGGLRGVAQVKQNVATHEVVTEDGQRRLHDALRHFPEGFHVA
jgi:hypothetical protein